MDTDGLLDAVTRFVDEEAMPAVAAYDREDAYPGPLVERMRELGLFGTAIPEEHGGLGLDLVTYARIVTEISRAWISLSGVMNTHFMAAWMLLHFGTREQQERLLPRMATGELRGAFSITEPHAGTDVQAIKVRAVREGDEFAIHGHKKWITNGLHAGVVMVLAVTDPDAQPRHRGFTCLVVEKEPRVHEQPGLTIPPLLKKLGYLGIDSTEMLWDGFRVPASSVLGGAEAEGRGFKQFMAALELGRVNVAARGLGLARSAFDHAIAYATERETFGRPIAEHQSIQIKLAQMATKIRAAELLVLDAAERKQAGERADLQAGMAKLFATETAEECALDALRIHGGAGYSRDNPVERLYRDAPLLILGEGSNEIQHLVIARRLLELHRAAGTGVSVAGVTPEQTDDHGLDRLSAEELHDLAVSHAKRHLDIRFFWELMKLLPAAEAAVGELDEAEADVMHLSAHVDDITDSGRGEVAEALRPFYLDYLVKHGVTAP